MKCLMNFALTLGSGGCCTCTKLNDPLWPVRCCSWLYCTQNHKITSYCWLRKRWFLSWLFVNCRPKQRLCLSEKIDGVWMSQDFGEQQPQMLFDSPVPLTGVIAALHMLFWLCFFVRVFVVDRSPPRVLKVITGKSLGFAMSCRCVNVNTICVCTCIAVRINVHVLLRATMV